MTSYQEKAEKWLATPEAHEYMGGNLYAYICAFARSLDEECAVPGCVMPGKHGDTTKGQPGHHIVVKPKPGSVDELEQLHMVETATSREWIPGLEEIVNKLNEVIRAINKLQGT